MNHAIMRQWDSRDEKCYLDCIYDGLVKHRERTRSDIKNLVFTFDELFIRQAKSLPEWFEARCAEARGRLNKPTISFKHFVRLINKGRRIK